METTTSEALAERIVEQMTSAMEVLSVHLGVRLGLYEELDVAGPLDAPTLAHRADIDPRYAREWLEQQAVAGFLEVTDVGAPADERTYVLPAEHRPVLVDRDSPLFLAPGAMAVAGIAATLPAILRAYRSGHGVPFRDYGDDLRQGIAGMNRPMFLHDLASVWMPALGEVYTRLREQPEARILDIGCGAGASTLALARAFPRAEVHGVDADEASLGEARTAAKEAQLDHRVTFTAGDAATLSSGDHDLVCLFEVVHDTANPVGVLAAARRSLGPGGVAVVAEERVAETFTAPGDEVERMMYGFSVLHCLPATMAEDPVEAIGTVLRPAVLEEMARTAGFTRVTPMPIDNPFWRFTRLELDPA